MATVKIALLTTVLAMNAIGPGRQVCVAAASSDFSADIYASKSVSSTKFVKVGTISGANRVLSFPNDSSVVYKYTVTAGSLGSGAIWVQGPGAGVGTLGSAEVDLATSGTDVSGLTPGRQVCMAGAPPGCSVTIYVANSTSGTFVAVGTFVATAAGQGILPLPNDSSIAMKYTVNGSIAIGTGEVYVTGGEVASFKARLVATSIGANAVVGQVLSITATGALGTQDGTAPAVGDVILFPAGLTNVTTGEAGPWTVLTLGDTTSTATFVRPSWWQNGQVIPGSGTRINVAAAGTLFCNTSWKNFNGGGTTVIGTDEPQLFPDVVIQQVTLSTGAFTVTNVPIFSATRSSVRFERTAVGGTVATTVQYCQSAITAGALGTATATVQAQIATGGVLTTDTSVGRLIVQNPA